MKERHLKAITKQYQFIVNPLLHSKLTIGSNTAYIVLIWLEQSKKVSAMAIDIDRLAVGSLQVGLYVNRLQTTPAEQSDQWSSS